MTRSEILKTIVKVVASVIEERTPPACETVTRAHTRLGRLALTLKGLHEPPGDLPTQVGEIISVLEPLAVPSRTVEGTTVRRTLTPEGLLRYSTAEVSKALADRDLLASLGRLHALRSALEKAMAAEDTASAGITVDVQNEPTTRQDEKSETDGSVQATAGTGTAAATSSSNFATNPGDVGGPAPSTAPNPSTASAEATAATGTAGAPTTSNYAANPGDLLKGLDALRSTIAKSSGSNIDEVVWCTDLNSEQFMKGVRKRETGEDFGRDPWFRG